MNKIICLLTLVLVSSTVFGTESCPPTPDQGELNACEHELVVNRNYSIPDAKETCALNACAYDLVVNKGYPVYYAKELCTKN